VRFRRGCKLAILNARIYLLKTISFSLRPRTFQTSFHSSTSTRRGGLKWIRVDLYPRPHQPVGERHANTFQLRRVDATRQLPRRSAEHWIAVNVPKSRTVLLVKTARRIQEPGFYSPLGSQSREPIQLGILGWYTADLVDSHKPGRKQGTRGIAIRLPAQASNCIFTTVSSPALKPTQPLTQWTEQIIIQGQSRRRVNLTIHSHLIVCLCMTTLTENSPCFFLSCKANARITPAKTGHGPHSS
jgi:hypothetical protein